MAISRSSKSKTKPSKFRLAKNAIRALIVARRVRANLPSRSPKKKATPSGPSKRTMVLAGLGTLAGAYLLRKRIPGPWRKSAADQDGGDIPATSFPAPAPAPAPTVAPAPADSDESTPDETPVGPIT